MAYSKGHIASYVLNWLVIIAIAGVGAGFKYATPYQRPFSLLDLSISYPLVHETVTSEIQLCVNFLAPALIIAIVVLTLVPSPRICRKLKRSQIIRTKLCQLEKGWAGLGLSLAMAFFITQGTKNLFGKPRPDLLARCDPDFTNIAAHVVGGYGQGTDERWTLVSSSICMTDDKKALRSGFRSFPSGHASFSWSGLLYLSLYLCSKFGIATPYLSETSSSRVVDRHDHSKDERLFLHSRSNSSEVESEKSSQRSNTVTPSKGDFNLRNQAAAPPLSLFVLAAIPVATAVWISSTRYVEFYHDGFDITAGALVGIASACFSFRWYHLPIRNSQAWTGGARSRDRALGIRVGTAEYAGEEGWESDVEDWNV